MWELDIFGKYRREFESARYDRQAAAAARYGVITSLIADVVRAYIDLRGLQISAGVLRSAGTVLRESLRIVNIRYERGITNELDVALATRELDTLEAQIAPLDAEVNAGEYTLAVLLGEYPETLVQELSTPTLIPSMPAAVAAGAPVDLLKRRPGHSTGGTRVAAATARIGVATANLFPQVALVGAIGSQSQGWGNVPNVSKHIWSFGPGSALAAARLRSSRCGSDIAHLEAHASLENYRKTILSAVQQVDTALDPFAAVADHEIEAAAVRVTASLQGFNLVRIERHFRLSRTYHLPSRIIRDFCP